MTSAADLLGLVEDEMDEESFEVFLAKMISSLPDPYTVTERKLSELMSDYCREWLTSHRAH